MTRARTRWWQVGAVAVAAAVTVALTQNTTTAAFTAQTADTGNSVTAKNDFCTAPGQSVTLPNATYPTVYDTAIYESQDTNWSTNVQLGVVATAPGRARTLIKFQLPARPSGCLVASADLQLHVTNGAVGASVIAYRVAATWNNATVSWTRDPGYVIGSGTATATTAQYTVTHFDVAAQVTGLLAGPDYGIELVAADEGPGSSANLYDSMDSTTIANRPKLVITWG